MNAGLLPDWMLPSLTRWLSSDPSTRVFEAAWEWRPRLPALVLVAALVLLWLGVAWIHRSRRYELAAGWRATLAGLRAAVVAVPVFMLLQPVLLARLERTEPRTLAIVIDGSGSMGVRDGTESAPSSRWQRVVEAQPALLDMVGGSTERARRAGMLPLERSGPRTEFYVFHDALERAPESLEARSPSGRTDIGNALHQVQAELSGRAAAGVVLLSDGGDNASHPQHPPLRAARELARAGIAVHTCLVGNERPRNISINLFAEAPVAFAGDPVPLRARIEHAELAGASVTVLLSESDQTLETREVVLPQSGEPLTEVFEVRFDQPGSRRCRVEVLAVPGELTAADNVAVADIEIIDESLRVLYIERWPRWQYRFLRNAFVRDNRLDVRLVLLTEDPATPEDERQTESFPATVEELAEFDAIIVGDLARQDLTLQQWQWLHDHVVDEGAGIIFIAGPMHTPADFLEPPLGDLLPFEMVTTVSEEDLPTWRPVVTPLGLHHPLMRLAAQETSQSTWNALPALQWYAGIAELKPGAIVLAERPARAGAEAVPLVVLQRSGRGVSLFIGTDESWKWRYEVGNRYFYGFWGQAIQHVAMPHRIRQFRTVRIEAAAAVAPGVPMGVTVALQEAGLSGGEVETLTLVAQPAAIVAQPPSAEQAQRRAAVPHAFPLRQSPDSAFLYHGQIELTSEGFYMLYVEGYEDRGDARLEVSAAGTLDPELAHPVVNPALLRQIAQVSGGEFVTLDELPALIDRLDLDPLRYRWSETIVLWDGWTLLLILAALLTVEWTIRKWKYLP
jgi:Mg-chelatase subunit ChlD/uncharacterized membrane protein